MSETSHSPTIANQLDQAFIAHHQWKRRLQNAAAAGEILDVETIQRVDCCELGQWLQGEGLRLFGHRAEFTNLVNKHTEFHLVTGMVADIINRKSYVTAHSQLEGSSQFSTASTDVGIAILRLKSLVAPPANLL